MMLASIVLPRPTSSARMARPLMWRSTRWATSIWCGSALIAFASSVISRSKPGTRAIRSASRRSSCQARSVGGAWSRLANASRECSSTDQTSSAGGVGGGRTVGDSGIDTQRVARGHNIPVISGQLSDWALVAPASPVYTRPLDRFPMLSNEDLAALLPRVALGDRAAFELVYRATCAHLLGVAFRILNSRERAEEVLQEAFMNVWHSAGGFDASVAGPMTWLINIVRNKAIDALRSGKTER